MKKILPYFLLALLPFFMTACFEVKPIEVGKIKGVSVKNFNGSTANIEFQIPIHNPNSYKVSIVDADVAIEVNGIAMGKIDEITKITLPANSNDTYTIPLEVNLNSLLANPLQLLGFFAKKDATVKINGWVKGKAKGITKKIDINETQTTALFKQ